MSSLNDFVINYLKPSLYLTYENDQYNSDGITTQPNNPFIIPDDSGNSNHAKCYNTRVAGMDGYKLGEQPLYELATSVNKSMSYGRFYPISPDIRAYTVVDNSETMIQRSNEFTFSTFFKMTNRYNPENKTIRYNIARKDGLFSIYYGNEYYSYNDKIYAVAYYRNHLNELKSHTIAFNYDDSIATNSFIGIFLTIRVKYEDSRVWLNININGIDTHIESVEVIGGGIDRSNTSPLVIGGMPDGYPLSQYWIASPTSEINFEHTMLFQRWITNSEISNVMKRSYHYTTLIRESKPLLSLECQDNDTLNRNTAVLKYVSNYTAYSLNGIYKVSDRLGLVNESYTSFRFDGYTNIEFRPSTTSGNYYNYVLTNSANKTISMWVKILNNDMSALLHANSPFYNYEEETKLYVNANNFNHSIGSICFSDEKDKVVNSTGVNLNDGNWHHIAITMSNTKVSLYIDGDLQSSYDRTNKKTHNISRLSLFSKLDNTENTVGNLAFFHIHNRVLPIATIKILYSYSFFFTIEGVTRLSGIPIGAELRLYNLWTGELIDKLFSDYSTGRYKFLVDDGGHKQLVALKTENQTVIPKVEAPIIPRINHIQR